GAPAGGFAAGLGRQGWQKSGRQRDATTWGINTAGRGRVEWDLPMKNNTHFEEWLLWKSEAKIVISFIQRSLRRLRLKPMCISRLMCISRQSFRRLALHP